MRYRTFLALFLPAALAIVPATAAVAQEEGPPALSGGSGGLGASFERYGFGDAHQTGLQSISLFTVPFSGHTRLFGAAGLDVNGALASGRLTRLDGSSATLSGLTDTQLALTIPVKADLATLTAVAILPTGKSSMTPDEAVVAGVVASELLPFRITNWGAGGAAGLSAAMAHSLGSVGVGASAAYVVGREYDLVQPAAFAYRPGNQLRARVALDYSSGPAGKASLQLTYLHSADDRLSGSNIFRAGDRVQAMGSYAFAAGRRATGIAYAGVLHRAQGAYLVDLGTPPAALNLFLAGGGFRVPVGAGVLMPSADLRLLRRADGVDQGMIAGIGGSAELPLRSGLTLLPSVRARLGRAEVSPGSSSGFTGVDLALGVRFGVGLP